MFARLQRYLFLFFGVLMTLTGVNAAVGISSYHDLAPYHTITGIQKTKITRNKTKCSLALTPYHSSAHNARNTRYGQVPLGDRIGRVNMLGLFLGDAASPYDFYAERAGEDGAGTTVLHDAYNALFTNTGGTDSVYLPFSYVNQDVIGSFMTNLSYDRFGVRFAFDYSFRSGLGVAVKCGAARYQIQPVYLANPVESDGKWYDKAVLDGGDEVVAISNALMLPRKQYELGRAVGIDFSLNGIDKAGVEDSSLELYWRREYTMKDREGDHVVTVIPYIGCSFSFPTAEKKDDDVLFALALGNDGFYGFTGIAELGFDFPGMIKVSVGGAVTYFDEQDIGALRVPTHEYQRVLYPWKTAVTKQPGAVWKAYGSFEARDFIDYLSCHVDYQYVVHEKDSITAKQNAHLFLTNKLERDAEYSGQVLHVAFNYEVTPALTFGLAYQATFAGHHIWKQSVTGASVAFIF